MIRRVMSIPGGLAHYVVGSAYVMTHLFLHEQLLLRECGAKPLER